MEWDGPAVVLDARPCNEADALATVMTAGTGLHHGLVRGGLSRRHAATWQRGNLVQARWVARLAEQLGTLTAEPVRAGAAAVMHDALALAVLNAACAVAAGALPEREPHPIVFGGLVALLDGLARDAAPVESLVRWEASLLAELGYALDLRRCAVSGESAGLRYVSPRTGRAVSEAAAGVWAERLLPLPGFLAGGRGDAAAWESGLRLTGHFLSRDVFGPMHRALPAARQMLYERVLSLAASA